jgi:hypothetical protein
MNIELRKLYESYYSELTREMFQINEKLEKKSERGTNPLLLSVGESYEKADLKIMFFGQETNFWLGERNEGAFLGEIQPIIDLYKGFYLDKYCFKYGGQFWNGISRLKKLLKDQMPDKKIGLLWNNVVKIGKCDKGFPYQINSVTNKYFNVISEEIRITKPDIIIFLSGPYYDNEIRKILGDYNSISVSSFPKRKLCKFEFQNIPIAFRTYHPNYLWRIGIDDYLNAIIEEIKTTKC